MNALRRSPLRLAALFWLGSALSLSGGDAWAEDSEVKLKRLNDGSTLIYNESNTQRARRQAGRLLEVPTEDLDRLIRRYAARYHLDVRMVQAVVQVESGYNPRALSSKGAIGLMQLMPATAKLLGVTDPWDPEQNIRGGTAYLRRMLDRFGGNTRLALAAYNAGPGAVSRHGGVPPYRETRNYVRKVLTLYRGEPPSDIMLAYARDQAKRREANASQSPPPRRGANVYWVRDANNQLVLTTTPPKER